MHINVQAYVHVFMCSYVELRRENGVCVCGLEDSHSEIQCSMSAMQ